MNIRIASNSFTRAKGLLWGHGKDDILVLMPCNDIHSCFMRRPIDVAFVGSDGKVLKSALSFPPWHRMKIPESSFVLERYSSSNPWPVKGDQLLAIPQPLKGAPHENMSDMPDTGI